MASRVLADMHVPPALRRWSIRVVLAVLVAGLIAWVPASDDARATRLRDQLDRLRTESVGLRVRNGIVAAEVDALRTDPSAIEAHARDELGMVYPGELVVRLEAPPADARARQAGAGPRSHRWAPP